MTDVELIAGSEDEPLEWYRRTSPRNAVRRHIAREWSVRPWQIVITPEHMRPATIGDDALHIEEGWHFVCERQHPAAIAVWRAELRDAPAWYAHVRRALRAMHPDVRHRRRAVLWGGRVTRDSTWLDRLLLGRWHLRVSGDLQLRVGMACWQWCDICGGQRPHVLRTGRAAHRPLCDAPDHFDHAEQRNCAAGSADRRRNS